MTDADNFDEVEAGGDVDGRAVGGSVGPGTPLCLECMQPVDPLSYYCDNCGGASNGLTQYIPFVNIGWYVRVYVRMCRQVRSGEVSIFARLIRLFVILVTWPLLLLLLPFVKPAKSEVDDEQESGSDGEEILQ